MLFTSPRGNIPPDFRLNKIVAVEVRRLNQNIFKGKKPKGLEQEQIKLYRVLSKVFREFNCSIPTDNYWIHLDFKRPIRKISNIESAARSGLLSFIKSKPPTPFKIILSRNVSIIVFKAKRKSPKVFDVGMQSDWDSGGWVSSLYVENINHCIAEKTKKIQAYKSKYCEWWLVLVDFLLGGIGEPEKTFVIQHINKNMDWKKVIVIHPETIKEILKIDSSDLILDNMA
jgi:hypothetical protein